MSDQIYEPNDRRPVQSRNTRWAEAIASFLINKGVSPNNISLFGMFAAITAGATFFSTCLTVGVEQRMLWFLGGLLCQVRLLCNLFDGMVAIGRNIASAKGELYNEVPDRVSDAAILIGLGYSACGNVAMGYLAALVAVLVAYLRVMAKSLGAPNDFCGPMAKPQRMAIVTIAAVYLALAPHSWRFIWGEAQIALTIVFLGGIATAIRRLRRTARFLEGL